MYNIQTAFAFSLLFLKNVFALTCFSAVFPYIYYLPDLRDELLPLTAVVLSAANGDPVKTKN